jgi:SAM-dependent methyltransferase
MQMYLRCLLRSQNKELNSPANAGLLQFGGRSPDPHLGSRALGKPAMTGQISDEVLPGGPGHQRCLLCRSPRPRSLRGYASAHLVRCGACGFVFSGAIPTAQELMAHYQCYGRDDYLSQLTVKRYHQLLDRFEPARVHNRILDVGCGIGHFPQIARDRGWQVYGTELTDHAVEICIGKGITMHLGPLEPANYGPEFFDVVTSVETLEHINTPVEEVSRIAAILRRRGLLYLTTPNFNSLSRHLLGARWNIIEYPEHLAYYTPETIASLLRICGFEPVELHTTGLSLTRLKTSLKISDQRLISGASGDEKIRVKLEERRFLRTAKRALNRALTLCGRGDTLKVLARKG